MRERGDGERRGPCACAEVFVIHLYFPSGRHQHCVINYIPRIFSKCTVLNVVAETCHVNTLITWEAERKDLWQLSRHHDSGPKMDWMMKKLFQARQNTLLPLLARDSLFSLPPIDICGANGEIPFWQERRRRRRRRVLLIGERRTHHAHRQITRANDGRGGPRAA